jgi:hypothetical protein
MHRSIRLAALAAAVLALATAATAQGPKHACGPQGMAQYDAGAEVTLKGTVASVERHRCPMMEREGLHLVLDTEAGSREVHLGPADFVAGLDFAFGAGDQVEVVGSPASCGGKEGLAAREVRKDGRALVLRDATGAPKWAAGPHRGGHHPHH